MCVCVCVCVCAACMSACVRAFIIGGCRCCLEDDKIDLGLLIISNGGTSFSFTEGPFVGSESNLFIAMVCFL